MSESRRMMRGFGKEVDGAGNTFYFILTGIDVPQADKQSERERQKKVSKRDARLQRMKKK
jgi:hypothetical protein